MNRVWESRWPSRPRVRQPGIELRCDCAQSQLGCFCGLGVSLQMQQEQARQQRRADRLARLAGPSGGNWLWRLLRRGWVQAGYAVADHTRSALILSVFAFKVRASLRWLPRVGG